MPSQGIRKGRSHGISRRSKRKLAESYSQGDLKLWRRCGCLESRCAESIVRRGASGQDCCHRGRLDISFNLIGTRVENRHEADGALRSTIRGCCLQESAIMFHHHDRRRPHYGEARQRCHHRTNGPKHATAKADHGGLRWEEQQSRPSLQTASLRGRASRSPSRLS